MSKTLKPLVILVEDEESVSTVIKYNLQKEGYQVQVSADGEEAILLIKDFKPDLVIVDWMLPSISGIELCRMIRATPEVANVPIIMLSAKGEEFDRISGLERGADDYIVKPFSTAELNARIKALFRRIRPPFAQQTLKFKDIVMDLGNHTVVRNDIEIKMAPIEFQILQILMEAPGRVFSREALIDKIWGIDMYVASRTVDVHVTRLRSRLRKASTDGKDVIDTVRLSGYCLKDKG